MSIMLESVADIEEKEARWLIPGYVPAGQITLLAGDGGSGKTTCWCGIAAAVSRGEKAFFSPEPPEFGTCEPGKVLFFSSEDSVEYTLKKRLRLAGADLGNIYFLSLKDNRFSELKFDSSIVRDIIADYRPQLCIFDPLQSFVPPQFQMSQRNAMRASLNPLIGLGQEYGTTFILVVHTNKKIGCYGRNRVADSADIWDISRSVLIVGDAQERDVEGGPLKYISHEKCNLGPLSQTALFTIDSGGVAHFKRFCDKKDADFVHQRDAGYTKPAPSRQDAEDFICDFLKNGQRLTSDLYDEASNRGISTSTLKRAKTQLTKEGRLFTVSQGFGDSKKFYSSLSQPK